MLGKSSGLSVLVVAVCLGEGSVAFGHSLQQKVGGYQGTDGLQRRRVDVGLTAETSGSGQLSGTNLTITAAEDRLTYDRAINEEANDEQRHDVSIVASQTWDKITETRVIGNFSRAEASRNRTFGVGVSQWFHHETFRYSVDVSRSVIEQESFEILDYDSQVLTPPPVGESIGVNLGLRYLASPKTIIDYGVAHISQAGRPASYAGSIGVRQFIETTGGAVHVSGTRALNRGQIGTETTYGQVDSWVGEAAYLQNMWAGAMGRVGYRYYKENEITRAYEDRLQLGTDAISVGFTQNIDDPALVPTPVTLEAAGSRILTNDDLVATTFETGLTAKF